MTRRFGGLVANSDVSLDVEEGEILGLIGPNGAGKSTLFNLIAGLYPPTHGTHPFAGDDITRLAAPDRCRARHRAHLPGGAQLRFDVGRRERRRRRARCAMRGAREARQKALEALSSPGLPARAEAPAVELTPPEKRRLEVARALATEPKLLLLDEVLTGLTPSEAREAASSSSAASASAASPSSWSSM